MGRIDNKVSVITGGAGGIGLCAGRIFAREGAKVLLVDIDEDALKAGVESIGSDSVSYCVADVTQPEEVRKYIKNACDAFGGIDIFLNNAGIEGPVIPIRDYPVEDFDKVMAVNVRGVWLGVKYMIPEMEKRGGGSIIITSSAAGVMGTPGVSAYHASKHAEIGIMRSTAVELAPLNIRVNTVNPSGVETRMMRSLLDNMGPEAEERVLSKIPLKRHAQPEDVANLMLFLASDEASYITGGIYMVDGGRTTT